jgi:arginine decarboxylase
MNDWNIEKARETYNLRFWGEGYFDINAKGHLVAYPDRRSPLLDSHRLRGIDLWDLAHEIQASGLGLPVLVRFLDILHDRVDTLCNAFAQAMAKDGYGGGHTAVYPIKVNQQRWVVEKILEHGGTRVGLEAGSKPELMAVLALSRPGGIVICNGYKDREYLRLALIGQQLGSRVYIVIEKLSELELLIDEARKLRVAPLIGVRVRLSSIGAGKWQNTGGEKSKFGLRAAEMLHLAERLRAEGLLARLQLLHFHMGSQIANIRDIQRGLREGVRYYAELREMGAALQVVDVGGGLGVDYEGTRSRSACSINYSPEEYAHNVVHTLWEVCTELGLPHPHILTEAGRAMTAHHAMLMTNVIDHEQAPGVLLPERPSPDAPRVVQDLWQALEGLPSRPAVEVYHDAVHWIGEAQEMFTHGVLDLAQRARAEELYFAICQRVRERLGAGLRSQREVLDELDEKLADKYFCNFSIFQSMPDVWAIDQIFPIVPLHRLDEQPERRAVLEDLTCDSDGRIDYYVEGAGVETRLPLHRPRHGEPYLLGIFLLGAYQEILGDMHNLFGDSNAVNVVMQPDGGYRLEEPRRGDTVDAVLRYVHFDAEELLSRFQVRIAAAPLNAEQRKAYLDELSSGLSGYTYLEH